MSQLSGAFTVETARLVEEIAQRTAVLVVGMLRADGSETYARPAGPEPGARRGARFAAVTDDGLAHDDPVAER